MTTIGIVNLPSVKNALIPYGDKWLKENHPEYPKQSKVFMPFAGPMTTTDYGTGVKDAEIDRKAFEIVKSVAKQEKVDLILKDDAVLHIANDMVILTDECVAEAEKLG